MHHSPIDPPHRGAAPVGQLAELSPLEAGAVLGMRLWCEGPLARPALRQGLGQTGLAALEELMQLLLTCGRRRLMRHGVDCSCLGGDEACFAQLVSLAADAEREEALMLAMLMIRADLAPEAVHHAQRFGLALRTARTQGAMVH